ncbi:MAG: quinone-dependent dihydroorotate dehydrogenase [Chitinophagaceae bacterium]|nr:quinone-dependent dihydroorotate dehydrogenase [Chitinophagaceae bacterium]
MYKIFRSFLFLFEPEWVHYFSMNSLRFICKLPFGKLIVKKLFQPTKILNFEFLNLRFKNKVGLAAGFDKNAQYLNELEALGFGFVEIGTVTPKPQAGNDKPRLFRLPKDKALINRMGFNNDGVEVIAQRLKSWKLAACLPDRQVDSKPQTVNCKLIIGGNIGKNKTTPNDDAWKDYEICFTALHPYVDYFVVNVSSPNTPGLRELQEKDSLKKILSNLQTLNAKLLNPKPILLKIAPDLTTEQLDDVIDLALEINLDGLVATNTTISREGLSRQSSVISRQLGGLSGLPVKERSNEIVKYIYIKTNGKIPIIASGGIFTASDAKEKLNAGASLIQVWTGFIYEGPSIVKKICNEIN